MADPVPKMMFKSVDSGSIYSNMTIHIGGVRCTLMITAIANGDTASTMPCGLAYWSDNTISVIIPGALISTVYTSQGWPLSFAKEETGGYWKLVKIPPGFPTRYMTAPDPNFTPPAGVSAPAANTKAPAAGTTSGKAK